MKSRLRSLFIYIIAITLLSSSVLAIFSQNLYAEPLTFSKMKTDEKIASYVFYNGLAKCVNDGYVNETVSTIDDIFLHQQTLIDVGLLAETVASKSTPVSLGDGQMYCETIAKAAFKLWGLYDIDNATILNAIGYAKPSGKSYECQFTNSDSVTVSFGEIMGYYDDTFPLNSIEFPFSLPSGYNVSPYTEAMTQSNGDNDTIDNQDELAKFCTAMLFNNYGGFNFSEIVEKDSTNTLYRLGSISLLTYLEKNVFEITNYRNYSPSLNDAHMYYLYKYYFQASDICGAKSYGPSASLTDSIKDQNIKNGTIDTSGNTYKYVTINILEDDTGKITEYSFLMQGSKALSGESFLSLNSTSTTCSEIASQLGTYSKKVADVLSDPTNANRSVYSSIIKEAGSASGIPVGNYIGDNPTSNDGSTATTCAINSVGWIICPVVNFMSSVIDSSWGILTGFLKVNSSIVSTTDTKGQPSATYQAWQIVRNVANVAFAIVFLIIIFSQITSFGISNYGIKKMLPKLIIAAILVNLSFYICQIAVDISNILGYSIKGIFNGIVKDLTISSVLPTLGDDMTGKGMSGIAGGILATAGGIGVMYASLGTLIPVLLGGIVAVLMVLFMLIGRQAIIVLLVVLSPLAFVAYLLPNTEKLFDKWKKLLMSLLLLFPIVALVIGASSLASCILSDVFTSSATKNNFDQSLGEIAAAAVAILPLFVVPGMLKKSLDGVGNIGGTLNKLSDKWGKGAGGKWTGSKLNKHIEAERANKSARIQGGVYEGGKYGKYNPNVWRSKLHGKYNQSNMSGKYGDKMSAMGVSQADKFNDENVGLATSRLNSLGLDRARIESIALGEDKEYGSNLAMRQAAIKDMVATNNVGGINKLWDKTIDMDDSQNSKYIRNTFANSLMSSSSRPSYLGGGAVSAMRIHDKSADNGQRTFEGAIRSAIGNNTYSPDKLARADKDEVAELNRVLLSGGFDDGVVERISKNAQIAISDNKFDVNKNIGEIEKIAGLTPETNTDIATSQTAQTITNSSNGQALVDQNGFPLQLNEQQTSGGSNREPIITNNNGVVIKDRRIR